MTEGRIREVEGYLRMLPQRMQGMPDREVIQELKGMCGELVAGWRAASETTRQAATNAFRAGREAVEKEMQIQAAQTKAAESPKS